MADKTFHVAVPEVGDFVFRRRTLRDELRIGVAQERLTEGMDSLSEGFRRLTYMIAALDVMTVKAPDGWAPLDMDPLDQDTYARIGAVYGGLRDAEERFRAGPGQGSQDTGEAAGQVA